MFTSFQKLPLQGRLVYKIESPTTQIFGNSSLFGSWSCSVKNYITYFIRDTNLSLLLRITETSQQAASITSDSELFEMLRKAWLEQGIVMVRLDELSIINYQLTVGFENR